MKATTYGKQLMSITVVVYLFFQNTSLAFRLPCQTSDGRTPPVRTSCLYNTKYLYFTHEQVSYHTAHCRCLEWNAELLMIKNSTVQTHIEQNMPLMCHDDDRGFYHIGLYRKNETWTWSDNSILGNYTNWRKGNSSCKIEPNGFKNACFEEGLDLHIQRSAQISSCLENSFFGRWYDKHENQSMWYYICEKTSNVTCSISPTNLEQYQTAPTSPPLSTTTTTDAITNTYKPNDTISSTQAFLPENTTAYNYRASIYQALESEFNVEHWESILGPKFAMELLRDKRTRISEQIDFPNIAVSLLKLSSIEELYELSGGNNTTEEEELTISFHPEKKNLISLNSSQLADITFPFAVVAAAIDSNLWVNTSLASTKPLTPLSEDTSNFENTLSLNKIYNVLAMESSILSVSAFVMNENQSLIKKSISAMPIFDIDTEKSLRKVEEKSNRNLASYGPTYVCVFLKTTGSSLWSDEGCSFVKVKDDVVYCSCNHTTSFSIMLAIRTVKVPKAISTAVTVLQCISILALAITILLLLLLRKKIKNNRTFVQLNLATSVLFLHVFFVLGGAAQKLSPLFCEACTVLSHFFLLSSAFWMLNEGIVLYFRTYKKAIAFNHRNLFPFLFVFAWGLPFVLVAFTAGLGLYNDVYIDIHRSYNESENMEMKSFEDKRHYFKYEVCWISVKNYMILSVIIPLSIVLILTTTIVVTTAISISKLKRAAIKSMRPSGKRKNNESKQEKKRSSSLFKQTEISSSLPVTLRAVALLLPVLGVPWVFGFMVNIRGAEEVFQILHGLINGLQGLLLFYVYCVNNSQVRGAARRKWQEVDFSQIIIDGSQPSTKSTRRLSPVYSSSKKY